MNSLNQTQTAVFTILLHILLPGDQITRMYLLLSCHASSKLLKPLPMFTSITPPVHGREKSIALLACRLAYIITPFHAYGLSPWIALSRPCL